MQAKPSVGKSLSLEILGSIASSKKPKNMRVKADANKGMKRRNTIYPKFTVMDSDSSTRSSNEEKEIENDSISTNSLDHKISSGSNSEGEEFRQGRCLSNIIKVESQTPPSKKTITLTPEKNILKAAGLVFDEPIIVETPSPVHTPVRKSSPPTIRGELLPLPTHTDEPTTISNYISAPNNRTTSRTRSNSPIYAQ